MQLRTGIARAIGIALTLIFGPGQLSATPCSSNNDCTAPEQCYGIDVCGSGVCVPPFVMPFFPLAVPDITAYTARTVAVMDHRGRFYPQCCDTEIVAFTGETAVRGDSVLLCPAPPEFPTCFLTPGCSCGYRHPQGDSYVVNGNYVGALIGPQFLSYDGHAGYDYGYGFSTPIVAPRAGNLCKAQEDPVNGHVGQPSAWDKFHTFYIDHGTIGSDGYATWYLHAAALQGDDLNGQPLQDLAPGECGPVAQAQTVATVGNFGTIVPHLHFEVRRYVPGEGPEEFTAKVIDAYGWTGILPDPLADPLENPQADTQDAPLWIACGNGRVECGETCDDGNIAGGDCCSADCQLEADGSPCDDEDQCTTGESCAAGICGGGSASCSVDHFMCYMGRDLRDPKFEPLLASTGNGLPVADQFGSETLDIQKLKYVCVPTSKAGEGISTPSAHLICYQAKGATPPSQPALEVSTQFQRSRFATKKPKLLCAAGSKAVLP